MMMESSDATGIKLIRPCDVHKMQLKSGGCLANDILTLTSVSLFLCNSNYDSIFVRIHACSLVQRECHGTES